MRTIKFRAWDKKEKEFVELSHHKQAVLLTDDGFEMSTGWDSLDNPTFGEYDADGYYKNIAEGFMGYQDRFIYLQFTGLHDKNGKEIYEGDVVEWQTDIDRDYYGGKYGFIYEAVEFKGGSFYPVCNMDEYEFEVIGNIFENPEMLITE